MNYFAHGRRFVDRPYFLAGTAVPDWLNVIDRRTKARSKTASQFVGHANPVVSQVAAGIVQHHFDDRWFHQTRAFSELNLEFTVALRDRLGQDAGFRPSFLGHILVELLLDGILHQAQPTVMDEYYRAVDELDAGVVTDAVSLMTTQPVPTLSALLPRFTAERFLYDYSDDERLLMRLNHVMTRLKMATLPRSLLDFFPAARSAVERRQTELLAGEQAAIVPASASTKE